MEKHSNNDSGYDRSEESVSARVRPLIPTARKEARALTSLEDRYGEAFSAYLSCDQTRITVNDAEEDFKARYRGSYSHLEAFAEDYTENLGWNSALEYFTHVEGIPAGLVAWDMPALLEVLESEYQIIEHGGGIHVFYK